MKLMFELVIFSVTDHSKSYRIIRVLKYYGESDEIVRYYYVYSVCNNFNLCSTFLDFEMVIETWLSWTKVDSTVE